MGFISFVGRVLFASLFLLSAYQEYVRPSPFLTRPSDPASSSFNTAASLQIDPARCAAGFSVGCRLTDPVLRTRLPCGEVTGEIRLVRRISGSCRLRSEARVLGLGPGGELCVQRKREKIGDGLNWIKLDESSI